MFPGNDAVKHTARVSLRGHWPQAIAVSVICLIAMLSGVYLTQIFQLLLGSVVGNWLFIFFSLAWSLMILCPLSYGAVRWFWRTTGGAQTEIGSIFYYFSGRKSYWRSLKLILLLAGKTLLYGFFLLLPGAITHYLSGPSLYNRLDTSIPYWVSALRMLSYVLIVVGVLALCVILFRYYLAPLFLIANEEMLPMEAAHLSTMVAKQSLGSFVGLLFGFVGWAFLTLLCGVPLLYAVPFFLASYCVHCRYCIFHYNQKIKQLEGTYFPTFRTQF